MFRKQKILREDEITNFLDEVALLLENNISLSETLALTQQNQEKPAMVELIQDLYTAVQQGKTLANALSFYPQYFPPFLLELLDEAEKQDALPNMLAQIVRYREATDLSKINLTERLKAALVYPTVLLLFAFLIISIMMVFVIPILAKMFTEFTIKLPTTTLLIFHLSEHFWIYGSMLLGLFLSLLVYVWYSEKIGQGKSWINHLNAVFLLHLPGIGKIYHHLEIARSLRTWDFMLTHNAPLDKALEASAQTVHTPVYAKTLRNMGSLVRSGSSFPEVLKQQRLFPKKVIHTISVGSRTGTLPGFLNKLANNYLQKAQLYFEPGVRLVTHFLLIIVWLVISFVVISTYLQLFFLRNAIF